MKRVNKETVFCFENFKKKAIIFLILIPSTIALDFPIFILTKKKPQCFNILNERREVEPTCLR